MHSVSNPGCARGEEEEEEEEVAGLHLASASSQAVGVESGASSRPEAGTFAHVSSQCGGCTPAEQAAFARMQGGRRCSEGAAGPWSHPGSAVSGGGPGTHTGPTTVLPHPVGAPGDIVQFGLSEEAQTLLDALGPLPLVEEPEEALLPSTEKGYVVSIGKKGWRRLHFLGGLCPPPGHPLFEL